MQLGIFVLLFLILLGVSHVLTIQLGRFLMQVTKSTTSSIFLLALIFFPGVLVHELGHFLMASFLFVRTGEIEFLPKIQDGGIKLGSVSIAHTDPFRRFLIGVAPVISGLGILFVSVYYLPPFWPFSFRTVLFGYILFEIGNTMFSSKKDMEGALGLFLFLGFIGICLFILGARLPDGVMSVLLQFTHLEIFQEMSKWVGASIGVNIFLWAVLKAVTKKHY